MKDEYFVTDDTALAAYLYLNGMDFIEATLINRDDPKRKKYIMHDREDRQKLVSDFYNRNTVVVPLDYYDARVRVMRFLKNTVKDPRK